MTYESLLLPDGTPDVGSINRMILENPNLPYGAELGMEQEAVPGQSQVDELDCRFGHMTRVLMGAYRRWVVDGRPICPRGATDSAAAS